jgi:hypothetical protein
MGVTDMSTGIDFDLKDCLTDPAWQSFRLPQVKPQMLRVRSWNNGKIAALVAWRAADDNDKRKMRSDELHSHKE